MSAAPEVAADKWLPLLEHSAHEVFRIMLRSKLDPGKPGPVTGVEFTAMVGLAGIVTGVLSVRCCHKSAMQIASAMLGMPPNEAGEHAWDALGEVANMVAGNFKNKIDGMSDKCLLSVPTVITGADYTLRSLGESTPIELWFRFNGEPLHIALEVHSGNLQT
jgi:CheY-specific phosphatase CheX